MPHPIGYTGGQDDDKTRSVDLVHIEPSIREGTILVSSLYGLLASAPLYREAPVNVVAPTISGGIVIPDTLTCNPGQWTGAHTPFYTYQWKADAVDINGATESTYVTTASEDGANITCSVTGTNTEGFQTILSSNSINVNIVEDLELTGFETYVISGQFQGEQLVTTYIEKVMVTTGVSADNRLDINRSVAYLTTGMSATQRSDINYLHYHIIQGIEAEARTDLYNSDVHIISQESSTTLVSGVPQSIGLLNPSADFGTTEWTIYGNATYSSTAAYLGYAFDGGVDTYSYLYQDVEMASEWETDIDAGSCYLETNWQQYSINDQGNVRFEFYNGSDVLISSDLGDGLWASPDEIHFYRDYECAIPANTRKIRVFVEFQLQEDSTIHCYIDEINCLIRKGSKIVSRDFGPTFERWRTKFTLANQYSGAALGELEFRNGIGGADLATGGSVIFGSTGLGKLNADEAFDDLRDGGFWAGQTDAISLGTAWVGYDMGTPVKPLEIDITARQGTETEANNMGREFVLEGSDDGVTWYPVQKYITEQVGDFTSNQQKQFPVNDGAYSFWHDLSGSSGYTFFLDRLAYYDGYTKKGMLWEAYSRLDISHLAVRTTGDTYGYELHLVKWNTQKQTLNADIGMISEILETITVASGVRSNDWEEHALSQTYEFEVGDRFGVIFHDVTTAEGSLGGKVHQINLEGGLDPYQLRRDAFVMAVFDGSTSDSLAIGDTNKGTSPHDWGYAVDFRGSFF